MEERIKALPKEKQKLLKEIVSALNDYQQVIMTSRTLCALADSRLALVETIVTALEAK